MVIPCFLDTYICQYQVLKVCSYTVEVPCYSRRYHRVPCKYNVVHEFQSIVLASLYHNTATILFCKDMVQ